MDGYRFIHSLTLKNFLSYGSEGETIDLQPLNLIIGPNASGKSNLIEAINLVHSLPKDIHKTIREGGGISEWLWKGGKETDFADLELVIESKSKEVPLKYKLQLSSSGQKASIVREKIIDAKPFSKKGIADRVYYEFKYGEARISRKADKYNGFQIVKIQTISSNESIFSQIKDPVSYPEISYISENFERFYVYREMDVGRHSKIKNPQPTDLPEDFLLEDGSNLGLVINNLQHQLGSRPLVERLQVFYEDVEDVITRIQGGTVQIFFRERGLNQPVPATRLSDGTLRYLCLLTILCHPSPPPVVCIEEPELGLHPDILPTLGKLLIEASQRMQLIVTTHSDVLVSALSEVPEAVMVCERDSSGSHLRRLEPERLEEWLENYALGELWRMGEIGATRW